MNRCVGRRGHLPLHLLETFWNSRSFYMLKSDCYFGDYKKWPTFGMMAQTRENFRVNA
jgi:hypothetical protein